MTQDIMTPDLTHLKLSVESNFQEFFKGFTDLLKKKFKKIEVRGGNYNYSYYTCGQIHDPRNPVWNADSGEVGHSVRGKSAACSG
jgi:hypothetical protein